jgi:biotin carboxyl carrier protein
MLSSVWHTMASPLTETIYKVLYSPGDVVRTADMPLLVLEAMKIEVSVAAGANHVRKRVAHFRVGRGVGEHVGAGDVPVVLE